MCRLAVVFITALMSFCLQIPSTYSAPSKKEISAQEAEDSGFIRQLFQDGFYDFAEEEAVLYLKKFPKGVFRAEVSYIRAQIDMAAERYAEAASKLDQTIKEDPNSVYVEDALYLKGVIYLELRRDPESSRQFDLLLQKYPQTKYASRAYFFKGQLLFQAKEWEKARLRLEKAFSGGDLEKKKQLEARNYIAWSYYFQGDKKKAEPLFVELLESEIDGDIKSKISFQLGVDAHNRMEYRKAISWFEYQINKWPHSEFDDKRRFWIAESLYMIYQKAPKNVVRREIERAAALYTRNLNLSDPLYVSASRYHRGWLYLKLGLKSEAEKDFRWLQNNDPQYAKDVDLTITRGRLFENEKQRSVANDIYLNTLHAVKTDEARLKLHIRIIRNEFRLNKCDSVLNWRKKSDLAIKPGNFDELHFYFGKCFYIKKEWSDVEKEFAQVSPDSAYARHIFDDWIDSYRKSADFKNGVALLEQSEKIRGLETEDRILRLKIEFYLGAKNWLSAINAMQALMDLEPESRKDRRFLLNIAQTYDRLAEAVKNPTQYERQALNYYLSAYSETPDRMHDLKTSLLEILIERFQKVKEYDKAIFYYQEAIKREKNDKRKGELTLQVARILLNKLNQKERAQQWLKKLHGNGNYEANFQASIILAELAIEQKQFETAIAVLLELSRQPIEKSEWSAKVNFRLGELYQARENWLEAIKRYTLAANSNGNKDLRKQARQRLFDIKKYLSQVKAQQNR